MTLATALEIVTLTDPGMVRSHNEDAVLALPLHGLVVLADGMGGYNAGEVASGMATAVLGQELEKSFASKPPQKKEAGMGTTLVAAVFYNNSVTVAHIGDSRLYRQRNGELSQLTRDHSLLQEQIDAGLITREQARTSQNKNLVTRALGVDPAVDPEIRDYEVRPGDIYLICSDGLNDMVDDDEIGMTLGMLAANLQLCAAQLVQMANDNGGRDNVSVILVKVKSEFPAAISRWQRLLAWFK